MSSSQEFFRWEEELRSSFLQFAAHSLWTGVAVAEDIASMCESNCSFGRADWVWASFLERPPVSEGEVASLLQQKACSRILAMLSPRAPRTASYLHSRSGIGHATFRRWLLRLRESQLVSDIGDERFVLGSRFPALDLEICAFEFKLSNWRRALYQAKRYKTFSHRVFVVMPSDSIKPAMKSAEFFRRSNIGLIEHSPSGESKRVIQPRKTKPASRSGLIRATGMLLDQGIASPTSRTKSCVARIQSAR